MSGFEQCCWQQSQHLLMDYRWFVLVSDKGEEKASAFQMKPSLRAVVKLSRACLGTNEIAKKRLSAILGILIFSTAWEQ